MENKYLNGEGLQVVLSGIKKEIDNATNGLPEHVAIAQTSGLESGVNFTNVPLEGRQYNTHISITKTILVPNPNYDESSNDDTHMSVTVSGDIYDSIVFSYADLLSTSLDSPYKKAYIVIDKTNGYSTSCILNITNFNTVGIVSIDADSASIEMISPATQIVKGYTLEKEGSEITLRCTDGTYQTITDDVATPGEVNITAGKDTSGNVIEGSIILNSGVVGSDAKYSVVGGTSDSSVIEDLVGSIGASVNVSAPKADAALSLSVGASTHTKTAGSIAFGFDVSVGSKGFYWDHYKDNDGTYKGLTISEDGMSATIALAKKQKRESIILSNSTFKSEMKNFLLTDSDYASDSAFPWKVGDYVSISNNSGIWPICGTITNISLVSQTRELKGILSTFSSTNNVWCITVKALNDLPFPFTKPEDMSLADNVAMMPHDYSVTAFYKESIKYLGTDTGKYRPVERTGLADVGFGSFGVGVMDTAGGSFSQTFGGRNITTSNYSLVCGTDNMAGLSSLVAGSGNIGAGRQSFITGNNNKILHPANDSAALGQENTIYAEQSFVTGRLNTIDIYASESMIGAGVSNTVGRNSKYSFIAAGNNNKIGGDYSVVDADGNVLSTTFYSGNNNIVAGNGNATYSNDTAVFGEANVNLSANSLIAGRNNLLALKAGETTIFGSQNTVGDGSTGSYANLVSGNANNLTGSYNLMTGNANNIAGSGNLISGGNNKLIGSYNVFVGSGISSATKTTGSIIGGNTNTIGDAALNKEIKNIIISGYSNVVHQAENSIISGSSNSVTATTGEIAMFGQGNTITSGGQSLVAGHTNSSSQGETFIAGKFNKVAHHAASVLGIQNVSSRAFQTVVGRGAAENANALFIVGNGSVDTTQKLADDYDPKNANRKNAFEVLEDGTAVATTLRATDIGDGTYGLVNGVLKAETVIANGIYNEKYSLISGKNNTVKISESAVFGSDNTLSSGEHNIVAGNNNIITRGTDIGIIGQKNTFTEGDQSFITGLGHTVVGSESAIVAGNGNTLGRVDATIANGKTLNSAILGGSNNKVGSLTSSVNISNSAILGGANNKVDSNTSIVAGGSSNSVSGVHSAILAGSGNSVSGKHSVIIGGSNNALTCDDSFAAGESNKNVARADGTYKNQIAIFGFSNNASCADSLTCGRWAAANDNSLFTVGYGTSSSRKNALMVLESGAVRLAKNPENALDAATKQYVDSKAGSGGVSIDSFDTKYFKKSGNTITLDLSVLLEQEW